MTQYRWTFRKEKFRSTWKRARMGETTAWVDHLDGKTVILPYNTEYDSDGEPIVGRIPKLTTEYYGRTIDWNIDEEWCDIEEVTE